MKLPTSAQRNTVRNADSRLLHEKTLTAHSGPVLKAPRSAPHNRDARDSGRYDILQEQPTFRDYILDTRMILCYIRFMNHLGTFLTRLSLASGSFSTCFRSSSATFWWKTWAIVSSAVMRLRSLTSFFMGGLHGC